MNKPDTSSPASALHSSVAYATALGTASEGDSLRLLGELADESVNLVITSPPFALLRRKEYGNKDQVEYVEWLAQFARLVHRKLRTDGSFVLDLGGAYERGTPVRSLYNFRVPIHFCDELGFFLAEDFYWFNPSKDPRKNNFLECLYYRSRVRWSRQRSCPRTLPHQGASCETRDRPSFSLPEAAGRGTVSGPDAAFAGWQ